MIPLLSLFRELPFIRIGNYVGIEPIAYIGQYRCVKLIVVALFDGIALAEGPAIVGDIGMVLRGSAKLHLPWNHQDRRPPEDALKKAPNRGIGRGRVAAR